RHVDVAHVARAVAIARHIHVAQPEREPAHGGPADAHADADAAAHPCHQRRRIDRTRHVAPRRPAPAVARPQPGAVVERREAPRRIVDPGPTPRAHIAPVAGAVRRPADRDAARYPDRAGIRVLVPGTVAAEVLDAGHLGRDVRRHRIAVLRRIAIV